MLKGIDPLLSGELLKVLDEMGHGDQLVVVDRNYPAASTGRPVIRMGEVTIPRAIDTILAVLPLDTFLPHPLERMEVGDDPALTTEDQDAVLEIARRHHPEPLEYGVIPRLDFYARAHDAFAIVHTLEPRGYGCFVLHKGLVTD